MNMIDIPSSTLVWIFGQIVAVLVCIGISIQYGVVIGFAVFYALAVLVDIRQSLSSS